MPGVTEKQILAARQMTAIEFLQRYRPEELVKAGSRGEFQLRTHDSFKINAKSSLWHWKSRGIGGKSALDYLIYVAPAMFRRLPCLNRKRDLFFLWQRKATAEYRPTL